MVSRTRRRPSPTIWPRLFLSRTFPLPLAILSICFILTRIRVHGIQSRNLNSRTQLAPNFSDTSTTSAGIRSLETYKEMALVRVTEPRDPSEKTYGGHIELVFCENGGSGGSSVSQRRLPMISPSMPQCSEYSDGSSGGMSPRVQGNHLNSQASSIPSTAQQGKTHLSSS